MMTFDTACDLSETKTDVLTQYNHDGYYLAKGLLSENVIENILEEFYILTKQQLKYLGHQLDPNDLHTGLKLLHENLDRYIATLTIFPKLASIFKLFLHQKIYSMVKELGIMFPVWQTKPVAHVMSNALKIPNGYFGFGAHQDWHSLQSSLNNITVWIPLVEVNTDNFTLELIPGSHKGGLCAGRQSANIFDLDSSLYSEEDFISLIAKPGDVLFMSNFTIHRSSINGAKDKIRLALSMRYEDAAEETFIERGYPFTEIKSINREVLVKDFPSIEQVLQQYDS